MKILLIDDDINLCKVIAYQLEKNNFEVITANSGNAGLEKFKNNEVDIVISDIQMGDISGIDVLNKIRKMNKKVIIIMITAYGSVENAINACHLGADDYLSKPFGQEQLLFSIEKAVRFRNLQKENKLLKNQLQSKFQFGNIISQSVSMKQVLEMAEQVANSETTVLLQGESGTGKEVLAKSIHFNSNRKDKPFITVNCPSIPDNLIESELFGHVKGAFTD
ncbi:MAG: sigma-54-dependent Fis family transcriptional regulator, partial [Calditrichia bacterium]|nr:sigma-54-dependent Fis family transcriptional regulator [Calditrichia bacterium]